MKPRTYIIIERCIEEGSQLGYSRAHKHTDAPSGALLLTQIQDAIMEKVCEVFDFGDSESDTAL